MKNNFNIHDYLVMLIFHISYFVLRNCFFMMRPEKQDAQTQYKWIKINHENNERVSEMIIYE